MVQRTQNGISYIHRSSQGQLVIETYIVFLLSMSIICNFRDCGVQNYILFCHMLIFYSGAAITIGMILLVEAGKGKGDIRKRRVMLIVGLGMFALFFGMILSIFKSKASGYPYSFIMS